MSRPSKRMATGFTLLELMIAIAMLSVISVAAVRILSTTADALRHSQHAAANIRALVQTHWLFRNDLQYADRTDLGLPPEQHHRPASAITLSPDATRCMTVTNTAHRSLFSTVATPITWVSRDAGPARRAKGGLYRIEGNCASASDSRESPQPLYPTSSVRFVSVDEQGSEIQTSPSESPRVHASIGGDGGWRPRPADSDNALRFAVHP